MGLMVKKDSGLMELRLNRPERLNALTADMIEDLADALRDGQTDRSIGAILLCGEGSSFCAGDDLDELSGAALAREEQDSLLANLQAVTRHIMVGPKPVIAATQGWVIGAAFSWLLNCDIVLCAPDTIAFFPELKWGVTPTGGATALLPWSIGLGAARRAFYERKRFAADELVASGIACRIVPDGVHREAARSVATGLVADGGAAFGRVKAAMLSSAGIELEDVLAREHADALTSAIDHETSQRISEYRNRGFDS